MFIGRIASHTVVTGAPGESILEITHRMEDHNVGTIVIVSDRGCPLGIVTDRDVAIRCVAHGHVPRDTPVSATMTRDVRTIDESTPVNPRASVVQGVPAYPDVEQVPGPVDLAVVVVPAEAVLEVARACASGAGDPRRCRARPPGARGGAGRAADRPGLGTGDEARRRHRHGPGRPHLPRGDREP